MAAALTSAAFDPAQFDRLLEMAGPQIAHDLIAQLRSDFSCAKQALLAAGQTLDWVQIRAQSHVIIGLAGIMGALEVLLRAKILTEIAINQQADAQATTTTLLETIKAIAAAEVFLSQYLPVLVNRA